MSNCVCDITKSEKDSVPRDCDGTVRVVCTVTHSRDCHIKRPCRSAMHCLKLVMSSSSISSC